MTLTDKKIALIKKILDAKLTEKELAQVTKKAKELKR